MSREPKKPDAPPPGGKVDGAGAGDASSAVPQDQLPFDQTTLLYLRAAASAFPRVQSYMAQQATAAERVATTNLSTLSRLDRQITSMVAADVEERGEMELAIQEERAKKLAMEQEAASRRVQFDDQLHQQRVEHAFALDALRKQVAALERDAAEASEWANMRRSELQALRQVEQAILTAREQNEAEIQALNAQHEEDRRRLRDLLVRKLRRVRDIMSSTADDNNASDTAGGAVAMDGTAGASKFLRGHNSGMLAKDAESAAAVASFQTPTTKLNEKLSRAVTMYERESKTIAESIQQIHVSTRQQMAQLDEQRGQNEKLVIRNAAQMKAKAMLKEQLEDLRKKHQKLAESRDVQEVERRRALQETVRMQGDVVADLRGELKHQLEEYEAATAECQSLERQLRERRNQAADAKRFFQNLAADVHVRAPDPLAEIDAPPSGFVDRALPQDRGTEVPLAKMSFTQMVTKSAEAPGLPLLGLTSPSEVAQFFTAVLSRKLGSL